MYLALFLVLASLPLAFPTTTDIFVYLIGLLCLPIFLYDFYVVIRHAAKTLYNKLEHAPPWNINKIAVLYYPRHYRKHGRIRLIPRYPTISLRHFPMLLLLLFSGSGTSSTISNATQMRLRHTPWGSPGPRPFTLHYYDIDIDDTWNPANIMASSRPLLAVPDDWISPATPAFHLQHVDTKDLFTDDFDPSSIVKMLQFGVKHNLLTPSEAPMYFNIVEKPSCYSSITESNDEPPLIVDTGASTAISPQRSDFITYHDSHMKIRGLSSSNTVEGEGLIQWDVVGSDGKPVSLLVEGCHIPKAEVRLLSPQKLLRTHGGDLLQTAEHITLSLGTGDRVVAEYCPRIPCLKLARATSSFVTLCASFWKQTFDFDKEQGAVFPTILESGNTNINRGQKEASLLHQKLSHASFAWIQPLMRTRTWLREKTGDGSFRCGSFLPCTHQASVSDICNLKCIACACAKAHRQSSRTHAQRQGTSTSTSTSVNNDHRSLKHGHTNTGCLHFCRPLSVTSTRAAVRNIRTRKARVYLWNLVRRPRQWKALQLSTALYYCT